MSIETMGGQTVEFDRSTADESYTSGVTLGWSFFSKCSIILLGAKANRAHLQYTKLEKFIDACCFCMDTTPIMPLVKRDE